MPTFSVIIPAFDEEKFLPKTMEAIRKAEKFLGEDVQIVVGDNMSNDNTREVAESLGAKVIKVEQRCISTVRNLAAVQASGTYLVFCDADDCISEDAFVHIKAAMETGKWIGGGIRDTRYDRKSFGITLTHGFVKHSLSLTGLSMFLFYTSKETFDAIGGFNEELLSTEDFDFARKMKKYGKTLGKRYCNLKHGYLVKSSRKFDEYGDYMIFKRPLYFVRACFNDPKVVYELWYKPRR